MERFGLHFSDASRSFLRGCRNSRKYFALWYAFLSPSLTYFHFMMLKQQKEKNGQKKTSYYKERELSM